MDKIERVVNGYMGCAAWADAPEGSNARYPASQRPIADKVCREFIKACGPLYEQAIDCVGYTPERFGHDFWLNRCGHGAGYWDRDELDVPPVEAIVRATDRDGKLYDIFGRGDTLGDILSALAYGTDKAISRFAYPNLEAWRGWLYFNDGAVHRLAA